MDQFTFFYMITGTWPLQEASSASHLRAAVLEHLTCKIDSQVFVGINLHVSNFDFNVYGFMWRSLIHLELSIVQGDKNGSIHILLYVECQLNQHKFLKMSFFSTIGWFQLLSSDHRCMFSFLGLQVCSIDLPVCHCTNTMKFFFFIITIARSSA